MHTQQARPSHFPHKMSLWAQIITIKVYSQALQANTAGMQQLKQAIGTLEDTQ